MVVKTKETKVHSLCLFCGDKNCNDGRHKIVHYLKVLKYYFTSSCTELLVSYSDENIYLFNSYSR